MSARIGLRLASRLSLASRPTSIWAARIPLQSQRFASTISPTANKWSFVARRFLTNSSTTRQSQGAASVLTNANVAAATTSRVSAASEVFNVERISRPAVGYWLLGCSALVFGIVVIGGLTRLTESGLSIVEWRPVTGILPPLSKDEWQAEFDKYKQFPEFKMTNKNMTLSEFEFIYLMEWAHRVWGRVIGMAFIIPAVYFVARKQVASRHIRAIAAIGAGIGFQGALGWYMVKSGLDEKLLSNPHATARVSQYRLAAHLGTAFAVYVGMLWTGLDVLRNWTAAKGRMSESLVQALRNPALRTFRRSATALTCLVFFTALSGAFVAGLDAGLIYNEFPRMGLGFVPPKSELFDPLYAHKEDKADLWWRSFLENPVLVQFDHRVLATTTFFSICALWILSRRVPIPKYSKTAASSVLALACAQVTLGITTLIYLVPVPLAAAHQAGSLALLTGMITLLAGLRVPAAARVASRQIKTKMPNQPSNIAAKVYTTQN